MTQQYPDVVEFVKETVKPDINSFILDSELVAFDSVNNRILSF
jgi:DNA ligase-1